MEAKDYLLYASAAAATQKNKWKWLEPFGYRPIETVGFSHTLQKNGPVFFDETSGLKIVIYEKNHEILISFGALGSQNTELPDQKSRSIGLDKSMRQKAIASMVGTRPSLFRKAVNFIQSLRQSEQFHGKNIKLTGQCLGGAIAQFAALQEELPGVALNSFPLGPGLQTKLGKKKLQQADSYLTHVIAKGDIFSNLPTIVGIVDFIINFIGFKTPGNFGKKVHIPTIYNKPLDTHYHILGSLFAHWKEKHRKLCESVVSSENTKGAIKNLALKIQEELMTTKQGGNHSHADAFTT